MAFTTYFEIVQRKDRQIQYLLGRIAKLEKVIRDAQCNPVELADDCIVYAINTIEADEALQNETLA